ncbi:MAG: restriction endonuclease subunit S [candidate division KSB1 bacterium]|nr:restriction endonuclease subunit S [candidate division KSB1 bacterium]
MKHKSTRILTPKLRFPEFRDAGKWNKQKLGDIVALEYGSPLPEKDRKGGRFPVIGSNGIVGYHDEAIVDGPAIVVGRKGSAGQVNWIESDCYPIDTTFFVKNYDTESCPIAFLWRLLERSNLERLGDAGAVPGLNRNEVYLLKTYIPSPAEQQKIAECLSSLDGLIATEGRKLEALNAHKKGLMQQLFPQPGETMPRLRFPEFRDSGEWENKTLEEVADYENGKAHEQDIDEHGKYIVVNSKFISTEGEVIKYSNSINLSANKDDILMVLSDVPNGRAIARCFLVDKDDTYTVNQRICKITAQSVVSVLLFYILDRNTYFLAFDDGVKQTNLKKEDVLQCPIMLPKDEDEQQRIAACLTALDTRINAQAEKIDTLKTHKRGLMQQLFPAMGEVEA